MADAPIIEIAKAIVTSLNTEFEETFTAERGYAPPHFDLTDLDDIQVTVVPAEVDCRPACRTGETGDYSIDVGVQKKVNKAVIAEADAIVKLADDVRKFLRFKHPIAAATWVGTHHIAVGIPEHWRDGVMTVVTRFVYRMAD